MTAEALIVEFSKNQKIIESILSDVPDGFIHFKRDEHSWSPLITICHLVDEEKEDFSARIQYMIVHPESAAPPINPESWVSLGRMKNKISNLS